jgi:hypothetical protein
MYAYDTAGGQWSLMRSMSNIDLYSLTYAPEEDSFYGLAHRYDGNGQQLRVIRFNPAGAMLDEIDVDGAIAADRAQMHFSPHQLASVGKYLAILDGPPRDRGNAAPPAPMVIHLLDRKTGKLIHSGALQPTPAPEAAVAPGELPQVWKRLSETDADVAARAMAAKLSASGDAFVTFIKANLPKLDPPDPAKVRELLARLDHDQWKDREEATAHLLGVAGTIEPQLRAAQASAKSEEVRSRIAAVLQQIQALRDPGADDNDVADQAVRDPSLRARLRAIRILARIATPAAVEVLRDIAAAQPGSIDSEWARAALRRI